MMFASSGLTSQPNQILQQLSALQAAASQQQGSPMQTNANHSPIYNPSQVNSSVPHHALSQSSMHDTNTASNSNAFPQVAAPPLNPFLSGSLPPNALTALLNVQQQQQQQQLPFPSAANPLPVNFPLPPWMQQAAGQNQPFALPQQQQPQPQRPLLNHHPLSDDQQMRSRQQQQQQQHDFSHNMPNQFQQAFSAGNTRVPQQQRTKLREPYLRVKNLSRKYSYRDVKLLFADYKLRLEDIKMINDQNGERTGKSIFASVTATLNFFVQVNRWFSFVRSKRLKKLYLNSTMFITVVLMCKLSRRLSMSLLRRWIHSFRHR